MMSSPEIWERFDTPRKVRVKTKKCIEERWKDTTKECEIWVSGRDREEDVSFDIRIYTNDPKKVPGFAEQLLDLAEASGTKVYDLSLELRESQVSDEEAHKKDIVTVERTYDEQQTLLVNRAKADERVRQALAEGAKNVVVFADINLLCEMDSEVARKVIGEAIADDFETTVNWLVKMIERIKNRGLATKVIGYELWRNLDRLEIYEVDADGDDVCVWLGYPAK